MFLNQVAEIWYNHLMKIVKVRTRTPNTAKGIGPLIAEINPEEEDGLGKKTLISCLCLTAFIQ